MSTFAVPSRILNPSLPLGWVVLGPRGELKHVGLMQLHLLLNATTSTECGPGFTGFSSLTDAYHAHVRDYPFVDYSQLDAKIRESQLLDHYARERLPPSPSLEWDGAEVNLTKLSNDAARVANRLASLLEATGNQETRHGLLYRRIVPSGGSRQPTEALLLLGPTGCNEGSVLYFDAKNGMLKTVPEKYFRQLGICTPEPEEFVVDIHSLVDRAMWRYREPRTWRALLLDAGHVIEALSTGLKEDGIKHEVLYPEIVYPELRLAFPRLARVVIRESQCKSTVPIYGVGAQSIAPSQSYCWNPLAFVECDKGHLFGQVMWPQSIRTDLTSVVNAVSALGGQHGIAVDTVPELLITAGLLLPKDLADDWHRQIDPWRDHGWYPSLLAHLWSRTSEKRIGSSRIAPTQISDSYSVLKGRRTYRAFDDGATVQVELIDKLLVRTLNGSSDTKEIDIVVWFRANSGENGLLYAAELGQPLQATGSATLEEIRAIAVRQPALAEAPCVVVLRSREIPDVGYEERILDLGRVMQKVILAATGSGLRTFTTPALCDSGVEELTPARMDVTVVGYALGLELRR